MGHAAFDAEWQAGRAMSLEGMVAFALTTQSSND
jgi:hypothetical protein